MRLAMLCRRRVLLLALVVTALQWVPGRAARAARQGDELYERYAKAPKELPPPGTASGLLVVDIVLKFPLGSAQLTGAALVATDSTAAIIRAKALSRYVVLFHDVPAGIHGLRFVTAETAHARLALAVPATSEFTVSVAAGGVSYLGTVTVKKKVGFGPPEVHLAYDAERERGSWAVFLKKYPNTPWADLVRARLDSLGAQQPAR